MFFLTLPFLLRDTSHLVIVLVFYTIQARAKISRKPSELGFRDLSRFRKKGRPGGWRRTISETAAQPELSPFSLTCVRTSRAPQDSLVFPISLSSRAPPPVVSRQQPSANARFTVKFSLLEPVFVLVFRWKSLAFLQYIRLASTAFQRSIEMQTDGTTFTANHIQQWNPGLSAPKTVSILGNKEASTNGPSFLCYSAGA